MNVGEKRIFGTYYSDRGPIMIPLNEYVWIGDDIGWAQVGSLAHKEFLDKPNPVTPAHRGET